MTPPGRHRRRNAEIEAARKEAENEARQRMPGGDSYRGRRYSDHAFYVEIQVGDYTYNYPQGGEWQ